VSCAAGLQTASLRPLADRLHGDGAVCQQDAGAAAYATNGMKLDRAAHMPQFAHTHSCSITHTSTSSPHTDIHLDGDGAISQQDANVAPTAR
jgi:hypothetical protein